MTPGAACAVCGASVWRMAEVAVLRPLVCNSCLFGEHGQEAQERAWQVK